MTTELKENPSTTELFDTSPKQEVSIRETSPVEEVEEKEDEKVVEEDSKVETKDKDVSDDTSPDDEDEPSAEDTTDWKQRYEDTQKWGNESNSKSLKLQSELSKLKDEYGIEDAPVDDTEVKARLDERIKTSESIERKLHGNEYIEKMIYADDAPWQKYKNDPVVDYRVRSADSPISEALQVLKEQEFHGKYGNDPEKIVDAIKKEVEVSLRKELKKEFEDKLKQKKSLGTDLSKVENDKVATGKAVVGQSTKDLFG